MAGAITNKHLNAIYSEIRDMDTVVLHTEGVQVVSPVRAIGSPSSSATPSSFLRILTSLRYLPFS